jgi:hypothetical protein
MRLREKALKRAETVSAPGIVCQARPLESPAAIIIQLNPALDWQTGNRYYLDSNGRSIKLIRV